MQDNYLYSITQIPFSNKTIEIGVGYSLGKRKKKKKVDDDNDNDFDRSTAALLRGKKINKASDDKFFVQVHR